MGYFNHSNLFFPFLILAFEKGTRMVDVGHLQQPYLKFNVPQRRNNVFSRDVIILLVGTSSLVSGGVQK